MWAVENLLMDLPMMMEMDGKEMDTSLAGKSQRVFAGSFGKPNKVVMETKKK